MRLALHPEHGQAEVATLEKENKRAERHLSDLRATQQRLQTDLSNVIAKRETYVIKVSALTCLCLVVKSCSYAW